MERLKIMRNLKALYLAAGVAVLLSGGVVYAAVVTNGSELTEAIQSSQVDEKAPAPAENRPEPEEATTEATSTPVDYDQPAPVISSPPATPEKVAPLERIPFTNKEVTPGDPSSYVDTYGQCPFYENAGAKGCYPPPGITCNADWSHCTMTYEAIPTSEGDQDATK